MGLTVRASHGCAPCLSNPSSRISIAGIVQEQIGNISMFGMWVERLLFLLRKVRGVRTDAWGGLKILT